MYNPNAPMNSLMRRAGSRSRAMYTPPTALPNIGQTPAVQAANAVMGQPLGPGAASPTSSLPMGAPSMAAPQVQPSTFTMHPPGTPADPNQYNYEPQPDGAWRVYPPGVNAPPHMAQASLPRAASTADYRRMRQAFQAQQSPQPQSSY